MRRACLFQRALPAPFFAFPQQPFAFLPQPAFFEARARGFYRALVGASVAAEVELELEAAALEEEARVCVLPLLFSFVHGGGWQVR